jgi:hypothetical protein
MLIFASGLPPDVRVTEEGEEILYKGFLKREAKDKDEVARVGWVFEMVETDPKFAKNWVQEHKLGYELPKTDINNWHLVPK